MRLLGGGLLGGRVRFSEGLMSCGHASSSPEERYILRFSVIIYRLK